MIDRASSAAQAKLADLLLDLFSVDELRRFIHFRYPKLEHELREGTSHRGQTESLTETLLRHGELDEDFFSALLEERPKRAAAIDAVAILFCSPKAGALAPPTSGPVDTPAGSAGRASPTASPRGATSVHPSTNARRERFRQAITRLDPDGDPELAIKKGLYVEEPNQSFAALTVARIEVSAKKSHILTGPRGTGKTTQLRILQHRLAAHKELIPVYIDAATVTADMWRPGTLSGLLLTGARDIILIEQGSISPSRLDAILFLKLASGKPSISFLKHVTNREQARKFVLLLDLPDRLPRERFTALCQGDLADLMPLVPVVIAIPQSALAASTRNHVEGFDHCSHQPTYDPAQGGTMHAFLMQVIRQRADDLIPPECCARLVEASGGALRDLLALAQGALEESYAAGYNLVEPDDVSRAINIFGRKHLAGLDSHDLSRIEHVRLTGTFMPKDDRDIHLLSTRRILEYANPSGASLASTFAVHPVLLPLLPRLDPLDLL